MTTSMSGVMLGCAEVLENVEGCEGKQSVGKILSVKAGDCVILLWEKAVYHAGVQDEKVEEGAKVEADSPVSVSAQFDAPVPSRYTSKYVWAQSYGETGLLPAASLRLRRTTSFPAVMLFDFRARNSWEMQCTAGDRLRLLPNASDPPGWCFADMGGLTGFVPLRFVQAMLVPLRESPPAHPPTKRAPSAAAKARNRAGLLVDESNATVTPCSHLETLTYSQDVGAWQQRVHKENRARAVAWPRAAFAREASMIRGSSRAARPATSSARESYTQLYALSFPQGMCHSANSKSGSGTPCRPRSAESQQVLRSKWSPRPLVMQKAYVERDKPFTRMTEANRTNLSFVGLAR